VDQGVDVQSLDTGATSTSTFANRFSSRSLPSFLEAGRPVTFDLRVEQPEPVAESPKLAESAEPPKLKQNPFTTYRDPKTGRWIVVKG